ncbi:hypothetical protein QV06_03290 [Gallibacterium genomosp. 3]|uniref:Tat proofreading chaperone DmsD n=1 Tax=Gallibacterium genomosp. 3 TaxID=505345 RepID=A0A1A7PRQ1_9PAST|nr:Tat proofreading chaperone DmsD [Gallibacterium genomosp. 3]OBX05243.1 hypothetical protein QV06_03290 [Gallibacterium genomosp. 3]
MEQEQDAFLTWVSMSGGFLGSLFYFEPTHPKASGLVDAIKQINWQQDWRPIIKPDFKIKNLLTQTKDISEQFQRQFIGPNALPAPPWGSVYLDKEAVIFGDSLLQLRDFMRKYGIKAELNENVPEDHIGLMLMFAAYIADTRPDILPEYLSKHLFSWVWRYLELLSEQQDSPFYQGLALVTKQTLELWEEELGIVPANVPLYF